MVPSSQFIATLHYGACEATVENRNSTTAEAEGMKIDIETARFRNVFQFLWGKRFSSLVGRAHRKLNRQAERRWCQWWYGESWSNQTRELSKKSNNYFEFIVITFFPPVFLFVPPSFHAFKLVQQPKNRHIKRWTNRFFPFFFYRKTFPSMITMNCFTQRALSRK